MPPRGEGAAGGDDISRVARVWGLVAARATSRGGPESAQDVCAVAVASLGVSGAWVLTGGWTGPGFVTCVTDAVSESLAEVQLTLGEGPCPDAVTSGVPVLVAELRADGFGRRWPGFADEALRLGAAAVFALPLRMGAVRVGVLGLYRDTGGALSTFQLGDALILADAATVLLLDAQAGGSAGSPGQAGPAGQSPDLALHRAEIDQATGMLTEQLGVGVGEAFARLRAYAYAQDRRLSDVARDIVGRRLRLGPDPDPPG